MTTACNALPTCWAPFKVRKVRDLDQSAAATSSVGGMAVQRGQVPLDVAEGDAVASLVGVAESAASSSAGSTMRTVQTVDRSRRRDRRTRRCAPISSVGTARVQHRVW